MKHYFNRIFKLIIILVGIGSFISAQDNFVNLSIDNVDEEYGTFDVLYNMHKLREYRKYLETIITSSNEFR